MRDPAALAGQAVCKPRRLSISEKSRSLCNRAVAASDPECADEEGYRISDRDPAAAQEAIVCSPFDRKLGVDQRDRFEPISDRSTSLACASVRKPRKTSHKIRSPTSSVVVGINSRSRRTALVTTLFRTSI
jgi:hypothetical protein